MNSIDNLKATIAKKGGLAMQNRFQIFFTPPTANSVRSLLNQDIGSLIGDLAKNAISGGSPKNLIPDPRDIAILCEAVSFPGRQISTIDYIPVYAVKLEGAFPTTISAINLDNNSENTVQKMTVTMSYENYVPEDIVDTAFSTAGTVLNSLLG